jgi:hypothetical protein
MGRAYMRQLLLCIIIGACAIVHVSCAQYAPPKVDSKTGEYSAMASVAPGDILTRETDVDLKKIRYVYLYTQTNLYPARFEFFNRAALAGMGFKNVLNHSEVISLVNETPELASLVSDGKIDLQSLSNRTGPALLVIVKSVGYGSARRYVDLQVRDLSDGRVLFTVHHDKMIWIDVDSEVHYPVFNELKKWVEQCVPPKERS